MIRRFIKAVALTVGLLAMSGQSQALPIGLSLVIDESGSIGSTNFAVQQNGYAAALSSVLPTDGSVAVSVVFFSSTASVAFPMTLIDSMAALNSLIAAITNEVYSFGGTNIGAGIDAAAADMASFGYANLDRAVIDVSTDGQGLLGSAAPDFVTAARLGTGEGLAAVNCLGIGGNANCSFFTGDNAFEISATTFSDIQRALETKLRRELDLPGGDVPAPGALALLCLALVGIRFAQKRA